ncbi:MAG: hypothetical protein ACK40D_11085 [Cyanobacteriota bacterium]|jgi:hypothetical protein
MNFRVRLVHADGQQRVVVVQAFEGERCLGSALGEASSAEEAEDRAIDRLVHRLRISKAPSPPPVKAQAPSTPPRTARAIEGTAEGTAEREVEPRESPSDPEDWSADLMQLDRLLRDLGWGREEERVYLQRLFGQPNRSRLTRYADLMALQRALAALPPGSEPGSAPLPLLRSDLLGQCDALLVRLGWTTDRARQALEQHFAVNSRQRLSDQQLLAFNLLLEGELLEPSPPGEAPSFA